MTVLLRLVAYPSVSSGGNDHVDIERMRHAGYINAPRRLYSIAIHISRAKSRLHQIPLELSQRSKRTGGSLSTVDPASLSRASGVIAQRVAASAAR
jgi:hypothetical protein